MATPTVSVSDVVVSESDGFVLFVVTLSEPSTTAVSVTYQADNGTAVGNNGDYANTGVQTLSFAAGETVKTVRVAITDDTGAEGAESFYLHLLTVTNGVIGQSQGTATIVDNDTTKGAPTLSVGDAIVDEKAGRAYVTLTLDRPSAGAVSVSVATADGSAVAGADYQAVASRTVAFAPGEMSKTVAIDLIDDASVEPGESFSLLLSGVAGATLADNRALVTIGASDAAAVAAPTVSVGDVVTHEQLGYAEFVVTLSAPSTQTVSVTWQADNGTAVGNSGDYGNTGVQTLSFAAGETVKTVRVALADDTTVEGTESFYLHLLTVTNGMLGQSQGTATIVDNDAAKGLPTLSVGDAIVDEKSGRAYVTLTLDKPSAGAVSVTVATADGSAVAGTDYQAVASQTVGFAPGEMSKTVAIALIDDSAAEPGETFMLLLSGASGATLADNRALVTIGASDATAVAAPTVSVGDVVTHEQLGYAEFVVTLSAPSTQTVSVTWQADNGTAVGNSGDYGNTGVQTLSFAAGETVKTVRVALADDTTVEGTESFYLHLLTATNGVLGQSQGTATIVDNDAAKGTPTLSVSDAIVDEKSGRAYVTLTLDKPSTNAVSVTVATADGTALAGTDYQAVASQTIGFAPGEMSKTVAIALIDDTTPEPGETFGLLLSGVTGATLADSRALVTLGASDAPTVAGPTVSVGDVVTYEQLGYAEFVVTLSAPSTQNVTVTWQADNGTAVGNSGDYGNTGVQTLSFGARETVKTVRVALADDTTAEGTEGFYLHLLSASNGVLGQSQGTATIIDNDAARGTPTLSVSDAIVDEKAGRAYVTLTLDKPSAAAVSVTVTTADGTALAGADYQAVASQAVAFAPGEMSKTVAITLVDDAAVEPGESFSLLLSNAAGATLADNRAVVTLGASDETAAASPTVSVGDVVTTERLGYAEFVVTLDAPSTQTVTVTYQADNGTAVGNSGDYGNTGVQTLSFAAGETVKTVRVALADDTTAEGTESFYLHLLTAGNGVLGKSQGTATILDDDLSAGVPAVRVGDVVNYEDAHEIVFTVTLDRPNASAVTVNAALVPDTAQPGDDYIPRTIAPITFAPGETVHEVHVALVDDAVEEEVESFGLAITLAAGSPGTIADGQAVATILDDDGPAPSGVPTWTDLAQLAQLAYRPGSWEQVAGYPYISSDDLARQPFFDNLSSSLQAQGWAPLGAQELFDAATSSHYTNGTQQFEEGLFTNQNAAAVVLRHGNALVISFRGTNDTIDLLQDIGVGGFVDHYQLLQPLVAAVETYRTAHPEIDQVYVTGHSLGGAMAEWYMATHGAANTWAVTFAAPGIDARDGFDGRRDGRILNFEVDGDVVPDLLPHRGYTVHFDTTLVYGNPVGYHAMDLYRSLTEYAVREGLSASVIADRFAHASDDELAVFVRCFEDEQGLHVGTGNDMGWQWYELPDLSYVVLGGAGADDLYGTDHAGLLGGTVVKDDLLYGGAGNDTLRGLGGHDVLRGGGGADRLDGGVGNDTMLGGSGNDTYVVDSLADRLTETGTAATEIDTVNASVSWTLGANVENLALTGTATIGRGNALANVLTGNASDNLLSAGSGNDSLRGSVGNDTLVGGAGNDTLVGGSGADRLQLNSLVGSDSVTGFASGTDSIAVSMAGLRVGDGDTLVEGAVTRSGPGGFARTAELVVFTTNAPSLSAAAAAAAIGSASGAYGIGNSALFVLDDGSASAVYLFRSANADALVSASELTLLATLSGTPATTVVDYVFVG